MRIDALVQIADRFYPDGMILSHWDARRQEPVPRTKGDGLAHFLVREFDETFDPEASDVEQLGEAIRLADIAAAELAALTRGLRAERVLRQERPAKIR